MADGTLIKGASGIRAAQDRLQASAHNVANINTRNFKKQDVRNVETPGGAVGTRVRKVDSDSQPVLDAATGETAGTSNVDAVEETVKQISAGAAAKANAHSVRAGDEMLGAIINIKK